MNFRTLVLAAILSATVCTAQSVAQRTERQQNNSATPDQSTSLPANSNSIDNVANEIALLRKSVQTVSTRLREITETLLAESKPTDGADKQRNPISANLELLARAEERAEVLRKQLIELLEKETAFKNRMAQIDEDIRPENIERSLSGYGTTRTPELREVRRRSLETERRGLDSLLSVTTPGRMRLEEDVRQADALVTRLRQRLLPLIDRQIEKMVPN